MPRFIFAAAMICILNGQAWGQSAASDATVPPATATAIQLAVPAGMPLPIVLDKEVRIKTVGQPVHGKIAENVYAFDKLVIPAGSEAIGRVTAIQGVSKQQRTLSALNANLTPDRTVHIEFDELVLSDGRHVPIHTVVSPASQGVLQLAVSADPKQGTKRESKSAAKKAASKKISETRQQIGQQWEVAKKQVAAPGKVHRLERYAVQQLPYHPQYIEVGTRFNAELQQSLDFGSETLTAEMIRSVGQPPPSGSIVHALLLTPLTSADSKKGDLVEAVITEPLFSSNQLILPQGSRLMGSVLQVRAARRLKKNGQLRIVFHQVIPPNAGGLNIEASLEGVEVKDDQHVVLDSEGGAQVTTPKTRYLATGISIMLAASSFGGDAEVGSTGVQEVGGGAGRGAVTGASGFRVLGAVVGVLAHSRVVTTSLGVYGAGMSIYDHFLSKGRDVVYPKDTAMAIGFGSRVTRTPIESNHSL